MKVINKTINGKALRLSVIELRSGREVLIDFDNFADAKLAGETFLFSKRDGQEWKEAGRKYEPLTSDDYLIDLGDDYSEINNGNLESYKEGINLALENNEFQEAYDLLESLVSLHQELELAELSEDEVLISNGVGVVKKEMMSYHEDVTLFAIGVYLEEENESLNN